MTEATRALPHARLMKATLSIRDVAGIALSPPRRRQALGTPLFANSVYLIVDSAAAAALGFVFSTVMARLYPTEAVALA